MCGIWILYFFFYRYASDIKRTYNNKCVSCVSDNAWKPSVSSVCKFTKSELGGDYINSGTRNYEAAATCNIVFNRRFLILCFKIFPSQLWHTWSPDSFVRITYIARSLTLYFMSHPVSLRYIFILPCTNNFLTYFSGNNCTRVENSWKMHSNYNIFAL